MELPTLAGVEAALARIRPHLPETPLLRSELLSRAFAAEASFAGGPAISAGSLTVTVQVRANFGFERE